MCRDRFITFYSSLSEYTYKARGFGVGIQHTHLKSIRCLEVKSCLLHHSTVCVSVIRKSQWEFHANVYNSILSVLVVQQFSCK